MEIAVLPGSYSEQQGLAELTFDLPEAAQVFSDARYTEYNFEDFLWESADIKLMICRRQNSQWLDVPATADYK